MRRDTRTAETISEKIKRGTKNLATGNKKYSNESFTGLDSVRKKNTTHISNGSEEIDVEWTNKHWSVKKIVLGTKKDWKRIDAETLPKVKKIISKLMGEQEENQSESQNIGLP